MFMSISPVSNAPRGRCVTDISTPSNPAPPNHNQPKQNQTQDRAIVQKDLDLGEWWAGVKARAHDMRKRQMNNGIAGGKSGGFLPTTAFVAGGKR